MRSVQSPCMLDAFEKVTTASPPPGVLHMPPCGMLVKVSMCAACHSKEAAHRQCLWNYCRCACHGEPLQTFRCLGRRRTACSSPAEHTDCIVVLLCIAEHSRPRKIKFNSCLAPFQASSSTDAAEGSWLERFLVNYKVRLPSVQRWNSSTRACAEEGMTSEDLGTMLEEDVAIEAAHTEAERESDLSAPGLLKLSRFEGIQDLASVSKVRRPAGMCPGSMGRSDLAQARAHHTA